MSGKSSGRLLYSSTIKYSRFGVSIRLRTTCIFEFKLEATCPSWPMLYQVDSGWFVLPTCLAGFTESFTVVLVPGYPEQDILHPFTWINVQGLATVHQGVDDGNMHRSIVPVGVLSSIFTATISCSESFYLLLRDREGLIGLGRNVPPGIS